MCILQQELDYNLTSEDTRRIWSSKQSLDDFVQHFSKPVVKTIVNDYFGAMLPRLENLRRAVEEIDKYARGSLAHFLEDLREYDTSVKMGPTFIRLIYYVSIPICSALIAPLPRSDSVLNAHVTTTHES